MIKKIIRKVKLIIKKTWISILELQIFRVDNKKIVFDNFNGKGFGCNPKYIALELIKEKVDCKMIWLVSDMNTEMPKEIKKVKYESLKSYYELATAKIWIDNVRKYKGINKKKNQFYIQTWHGGISLKRFEKDVEETLSPIYVAEAKNDGKIMDLLITNNEDQKKYFEKVFWYDGEILCNGTPRNDIIYKNDKNINKKVYEYFDIDENKKIVMYAPTFRKDHNMGAYMFDYEECCKRLCEKFGNEFIMLIRLHPNIAEQSEQIKYMSIVKNASKYPDIQELIAATDVVITDYSSVSFDAGLVYKPVFIIAKDFEEYTKNDRKLLYDMNELPFDISKTEMELYQNIEKFNLEDYKEKLNLFYTKIGVVHNNNSAKDIVEIIKEKIKCKKGK